MDLNAKPKIEIDGLNWPGKSIVISRIKENLNEFNIIDGTTLRGMINIYPDDLPLKLPSNTLYFVLDYDNHNNNQDNYSVLFKERNRFRRLAIRYQAFFIETHEKTLNDLANLISSIILNPSVYHADNIIPNPDNFSKEDYDKLELLIEGESKIIRILNSKYSLISYKPTVHSHKQQRAGIIEGTDKERKKMTKDILYLLDKDTIPHAYIYVGDNYTLCERLDPFTDIPPIEVIVKRCCVGTDKFRYYGIDKKKTRFGGYVVTQDENREYPDIFVRFDYRNPNYHPETKKPLGDEALYDDLADNFICVKESKTLARKTFLSLSRHFELMGIYFVDVCFMLTTDGKKHFYEISQDCGRFKRKDESGMTDLDKDIWRAGGSSDLVLKKWSEITKITHDYVRKNYN